MPGLSGDLLFSAGGWMMEIAAIGDSLTTSARVSSFLDMARSFRACADNNWFVDSSGRIQSCCCQLNVGRDLVSRNYSSISAAVDLGTPRTILDWFLGTYHFSSQVSAVVAQPRFPDVLLIWIGHNNVNWAAAPKTVRTTQRHELFNRIEREFRQGFQAGLERLLGRARSSRYQVDVVVFALADLEAFFRARARAEAERLRDPGRFPYAKRAQLFFPSLAPENRDGTIELGNRLNKALQDVTATTRRTIEDSTTLRLHYSDKLFLATPEVPEALSPLDAFHPSERGHQLFADAACRAISEQVWRKIG
jgi:lysophospholipase L1-like esterase